MSSRYDPAGKCPPAPMAANFESNLLILRDKTMDD